VRDKTTAEKADSAEQSQQVPDNAQWTAADKGCEGTNQVSNKSLKSSLKLSPWDLFGGSTINDAKIPGLGCMQG